VTQAITHRACAPCWPCGWPAGVPVAPAARVEAPAARDGPCAPAGELDAAPLQAAANMTRRSVAPHGRRDSNGLALGYISLVDPRFEGGTLDHIHAARGCYPWNHGGSSFVSRSAITRPNSAREVTRSLPYKLARCVSTVRGLVPNSAATSRVERPSPASRATRASVGVRASADDRVKPRRACSAVARCAHTVAPRAAKTACARRSASSASRRLRAWRSISPRTSSTRGHRSGSILVAAARSRGVGSLTRPGRQKSELWLQGSN
jgi:hypothetical protein